MLNQLRLWSGLILLLYVVGHLTNVSLGLISLEAMNAGISFFMAPWRSLPGTVILAGAALIHAALGFYSLYRRGRFGLRDYRSLQLFLGLAIPFLLAGHAIGTRGLFEAFDFKGDYTFELLILYVYYPSFGILQVVLLLTVWLHAWLGLATWLKLKPGFRRYRQAFIACGYLVPAIALSAFLSVGLQVRALAADEAWLNTVLQRVKFDPDYMPWVFEWVERTLLILVAIVILLLVLRALASWQKRARGSGRLTYLGEKSLRIEIRPGATVLELVQGQGQEHASACGGRGRCSTCRVHIVAGAEAMPAPSAAEARVLDRIAAPADVRLACQLRPAADLTLAPLLPASAAASSILADMRTLHGREAQIAVLFADIRDFTPLSEQLLPYDTVFLLNRYFAAMGRAIENAGGHIDKFIGDGLMALFDAGDAQANGRAALAAARAMADELAALNQSLTGELGEPLRIGIGIHFGAAIIGRMGFGQAAQVTAIGDTVNVASRLEQLTKQHAAQLVVSEEVLRTAGIELPDAPLQQAEVRGISETVAVRVLADARSLGADGIK